MVLSVMVHQYILDKLFFYWSFGLLLLGISAARKVQPGRYGSTGESAVQCIKVPDKIKNVDTDFGQSGTSPTLNTFDNKTMKILASYSFRSLGLQPYGIKLNTNLTTHRH